MAAIPFPHKANQNWGPLKMFWGEITLIVLTLRVTASSDESKNTLYDIKLKL
jgi:hypothetical protein